MTLDIERLPRVCLATDGAGMVALDSSPDGFEDIVKGGSRPLALVEGGNPPTEYLMFVAGINETVKGPLLFDDAAAAAVMAFYESRGRKRIAGDWEHDSMNPPEQRPPNYQGSPASHWFVPAVRPGPELWATEVKWTPTAFAQLSRGEYAHTSPVVKFEKKTGRITAVLSSALTNDPATIGQPQLVAASAESTKPLAAASPEKPMKFKLSDDEAMKIKTLVDGEHESRDEMMGKMKACLSEMAPGHFGEKKEPDKDPADAAKLAENMGKEEDAAKLDVDPNNAAQNAAVHIKTGATHSEPGSVSKNAAVSDSDKRAMTAGVGAFVKLQNAVATLTNVRGVDRQIGALTAMKHQSEEVAALTARASSLASGAFDAIVTKAHKEKRLTPADIAAGSKTRAGTYIATLRNQGESGLLALSAYVERIPPQVTTAETAIAELKSPVLDDGTVIKLTAAELESCTKNGLDPVRFLATKIEHKGTVPRA